MQSERHRSGSNPTTRFVRIGWVAFCLLFSVACHLDMYNQPRYEPYEESNFFLDGAASRPIEPGTVSRAQLRSSEIATGKSGSDYVTQNPIQVTDELRERGQERFNIFCTPCHGQLGNGKGVAATYFNPRPTSFYLDRIVQAPDGYLYDVITNGKGQMFPYASRVPVEDRWAIVAYIRQIQQEPPTGVKPEDRLEPTPAPPATAAPAAPQPTPAS